MALGTIFVFGLWFVYDHQRLREQSWEGTISETWTEEDWFSRGRKMTSSSTNRRRISYYWKVAGRDGSTFDVKVTTGLGRRANVGDRVIKRSGERYPQLAFELEQRARGAAH